LGHQPDGRLEKRARIRVLCDKQNPPVLQIKDQEFKIIDISRAGLKVAGLAHHLSDLGPVKLTVKFPNDDVFILDGSIIWSDGSECGIKLKTFLPETMEMKQNK